MDRVLRLLGTPLPPRRSPWVLPAVLVGLLLGGLSGLAAASSVPRVPEVSASDDEEAPPEERPLQPEDVGARMLEMLSDQLQEGADKLEQKADARYAEKQRTDRRAPRAPDPVDVQVVARPSAPPAVPPLRRP